MRYVMRMTGSQHEALRAHLFPGDGKEAVALLLCGRHCGDDVHCFLVHEVALVPREECPLRERARLRWNTNIMPGLLQKVMKHQWALIKMHSHPNGLEQFSSVDDGADADLYASVMGWADDDHPHASAIMLPDGRIIARAILRPDAYQPMERVAVVGDDVTTWRGTAGAPAPPAHAESHEQLFGSGTVDKLKHLTIGVVGVSGTGSIVVELLARLGVGSLVLVDPDRIEKRNLNRILHARLTDVGRLKTDVARESVEAIGFETVVRTCPLTLGTRAAVRALAPSDFVFGCVDSAEGRLLLNKLATYYTIPYVDVGIKLEADGKAGIGQICGSIHYLRPGGSSLVSRNAITLEQARADALRRTNPDMYAEHVREKYIKGARVNQPAVVSLNTFYASMAVNEFLARIHPYRDDDNANYAWTCISLTQHHLYPSQPDGAPCLMLQPHVGKGDMEPLLGMPALSKSLQSC